MKARKSSTLQTAQGLCSEQGRPLQRQQVFGEKLCQGSPDAAAVVFSAKGSRMKPADGKDTQKKYIQTYIHPSIHPSSQPASTYIHLTRAHAEQQWFVVLEAMPVDWAPGCFARLVVRSEQATSHHNTGHITTWQENHLTTHHVSRDTKQCSAEQRQCAQLPGAAFIFRAHGRRFAIHVSTHASTHMRAHV